MEITVNLQTLLTVGVQILGMLAMLVAFVQRFTRMEMKTEENAVAANRKLDDLQRGADRREAETKKAFEDQQRAFDRELEHQRADATARFDKLEAKLESSGRFDKELAIIRHEVDSMAKAIERIDQRQANQSRTMAAVRPDPK